MALSKEDVVKVCSLPSPDTKGFFVRQAVLRIEDPKSSLDFYTRIMGMTLLKKFDFPATKFSLYFLAYADPATVPKDDKEAIKFCLSRPATLELTHKWKTNNEVNTECSSGEPKGHISVMVPDIYKCCERLESLDVPFVKTDKSKKRGLFFVKDPDGYWIEILKRVKIE